MASSIAPPGPVARQPAPAPAASVSQPPRPLLSESEICEQELTGAAIDRVKRAEAPALAKAWLKETTIKGKIESALPTRKIEEAVLLQPSEQAAHETVTVQPNSSLIARITSDTPPQRSASLRIADEGVRLLEAKQYEKALLELEKAISVDSRNRYAYYYLAQAHYYLESYEQSLNFLEIVETAFSNEPLWLARIYALQGESYVAQGLFERADEKYLKALALDPSNRVALEGLAYLPRESASPIR